jgi:electron transfer flavoprotein alpha subunit
MALADTSGGRLSAATAEVLGTARKLADEAGGTVVAVLPSTGISDSGNALIHLGADRAILVDDPLLAEYEGGSFTAVVNGVIDEVKPSVFLCSLNDIGRDLAPRIAYRQRSHLAVDCVDLRWDEGRLILSRPVWGGSATAEVTARGEGVRVVSLRPKAFARAEPDPSRTGEIETRPMGPEAASSPVKFLEKASVKTEGVRLEDARVVISGGRGLGGAENFKCLEDLTEVLGGALGASRAAVDAGWVPPQYQVGQTGKIVGPDLYIAVGISGATQHMVGASPSKNIVAINTDPEAPIFERAHFGVVGDYKKVIPAFTAKCRELMDT